MISNYVSNIAKEVSSYVSRTVNYVLNREHYQDYTKQNTSYSAFILGYKSASQRPKVNYKTAVTSQGYTPKA